LRRYLDSTAVLFWGNGVMTVQTIYEGLSHICRKLTAIHLCTHIHLRTHARTHINYNVI